MKKLKTKKTSVQKGKRKKTTKQIIFAELKKYEKRASNNGLKWDYERAKKIHNRAKKTENKFETIFRKEIKKSKANKLKYIEKRYALDKDEAVEVLEARLKKKIKYSVKVKEIKQRDIPFPVEYKNLLEIVDTLESAIKSGIMAAGCDFEFIAGSVYFKGDPADFIKRRNEYAELLSDEYEDVIKDGYEKVMIMFTFKQPRNFQGKVKKYSAEFLMIKEVV